MSHLIKGSTTTSYLGVPNPLLHNAYVTNFISCFDFVQSKCVPTGRAEKIAGLVSRGVS